jgi:hypothetical protein
MNSRWVVTRFPSVARDFSRLQNVKLLEDFVLRECDDTTLGNRFLTIRDDILPSSSGLEMYKKNRLPTEAASCPRRVESSGMSLCRYQNPHSLFPLQEVAGAFHQDQSDLVIKLTSDLHLRPRVGVDEVIPQLLVSLWLAHGRLYLYNRPRANFGRTEQGVVLVSGILARWCGGAILYLVLRRRFITLFTTVSHWTVSSTRWIPSSS